MSSPAPQTDVHTSQSTGSGEADPYSDLASKAHSLAHTSAARIANVKQARTVAAQAERIDRTEAALAGAGVVDQLQRSFPVDDRHGVVARIVNAAIPLAPLFLLKSDPEKQESGIGSFIAKPQVWPVALVAGIIATKEITGIARKAQRLIVDRNIPELNQGRSFRLLLLNGADPNSADWTSDNDAAITVDKGLVHAVGNNNAATITVKHGDQEDSVLVRVR